jgi:hypothetical protein
MEIGSKLATKNVRLIVLRIFSIGLLVDNDGLSVYRLDVDESLDLQNLRIYEIKVI